MAAAKPRGPLHELATGGWAYRYYRVTGECELVSVSTGDRTRIPDGVVLLVEVPPGVPIPVPPDAPAIPEVTQEQPEPDGPKS
jgi:hypothetical protein